MALVVGQPAPYFQAQSDDGIQIDLQDLQGRWVFLFFYPRANTPGCSMEARDIEAALPEFEHLGIQVIGISTDTEARQAHFRSRCVLSYPLVPDNNKVIAKSYHVFSGFGALFGMASRQSFLIDPKGLLAYHWKKVNPIDHAHEVLQYSQEKIDQYEVDGDKHE